MQTLREMSHCTPANVGMSSKTLNSLLLFEIDFGKGGRVSGSGLGLSGAPALEANFWNPVMLRAGEPPFSLRSLSGSNNVCPSTGSTCNK